ncbi:MFS transporter [Nesterenkonia ebinurensis]|uniref:MFS transporter n=1 Tax=Nesterenkonia ebinurensis TaxID=2608252 RepID=UPI0037C81B81
MCFGFIFPVALCISSVAGGVWVTIRNRKPAPHVVIIYLAVTSLGAGLVAWNHAAAITLGASLLVGFCLPLMATYFQLVLDELAPPNRRAEVFAMLRNANSIGIITISLTLTFWSLAVALTVGVILMLIATLAVIGAQVRGTKR